MKEILKAISGKQYIRLNKNLYQYDIDFYTFDETPIKINDLIPLLEEWENDIYISIELI